MLNWKKIKMIWSEFQKMLGLSLTLAQTDFKSRNEGSYLGVLWYLLNPLLMFALLWFIFSKQLGQNIPLYPAYLLLGVLTFNFFQQATNESVGIILANGNLIKSIHFPYKSLVLAVVLRTFFSHIIEVVIFVVLLFFFRIDSIGIFFYPLILFFYIMFVYGISLLLAVITVYVVDFINVWHFFSLLLWLATPIFYQSNNYDHLGGVINAINPLYYFLNIFRDVVLYSRAPSILAVIVVAIISLGVLLISNFVFARLKYKMVEKI